MTATTTFDGLTLAHDADEAGQLRPDSVMGVTRTSETLINTTPIRPIETALDLGCGSGLFALLAARRANRVVATDLNARACDFVEQNASSNGFDNVETRVGSMFEPVAGERFDLITSNLPFVVSPDSEYVFRDGGMGGDEISRLAVTEAPEHLTESGIAVITASWTVRHGETWQDTVAGWIDPLDCDAWVLGGATQTPEDYVYRWNGALLHNDPAAYTATRTRWLDYYRDEGIDELCYGVIILHRRQAADRWKQIDTQEVGPTTGGGAQVDRGLRNGPAVLALDDAGIDGLVPSLVAPHHLDQRLAFTDHGYEAHTSSMVLAKTCGVVGSVEPLTSQVLLRLDAQTPLGEIVDAAAAETGIARTDLAEPARRDVRHLARTGIIDLA